MTIELNPENVRFIIQKALEDARDAWNNRTAQYLIGTPQLADYLEEGLALHGYDVD